MSWLATLDQQTVIAVLLILSVITNLVLACVIAHVLNVNDNKVARIEIVPTGDC